MQSSKQETRAMALKQINHVVLHPLAHLQAFFREKLNESYVHLTTAAHRFEQARSIHEELSKLIGGKESFFGDEEGRGLSSLDIVAYAYLKEELNNTPESKEVSEVLLTMGAGAGLDQQLSQPHCVRRSHECFYGQ